MKSIKDKIYDFSIRNTVEIIDYCWHPSAIHSNYVDLIAYKRGWLPLVDGESMTVHFIDKNGVKAEYVIRRVKK